MAHNVTYLSPFFFLVSFFVPLSFSSQPIRPALRLDEFVLHATLHCRAQGNLSWLTSLLSLSLKDAHESCIPSKFHALFPTEHGLVYVYAASSYSAGSACTKLSFRKSSECTLLGKGGGEKLHMLDGSMPHAQQHMPRHFLVLKESCF